MPVRTVLILSAILALVCLAACLWAALRGPWWLALILGALALWFGVDAWRAWGWSRKP